MSSTELSLLRSTSLSTYDLSDALHALHTPNAGALVDLLPLTPPCARVVGFASTVRFAPKRPTPPTPQFAGHFADVLPCSPDHIPVLSQPAGQRCAVLGGLVAARLQARGAASVVIGGRVRDMPELVALGMGVWGAGRSTVGAGAEAVAVEIGGDVMVGGVLVYPGDLVVADEGGVVVVPRGQVREVVEMAERMVEADRKVREDVAKGRALGESMREHRGK
ncbi:DlpA domain protein [Geopyxis carbonaria]|nr:DlpA domain protein [Geopyxis carbonaria]